MEVSLIPNRLVNSDLGVVNAARVSFAKQREEVLLHGDPRIPTGESGDDRLINFLFKHQHWAPLAHPHFVFSLRLSVETLIRFAVHQPGGVRLIPELQSGDHERYLLVGSLYGLYRALPLLNETARGIVSRSVMKHAPLAYAAFGLSAPVETSGGYRASEEDVLAEEAAGNRLTFKAVTRTFRIKAPIFVARQLVKHQRELVWNEVSRRYVTSSPTFFQPKDWRAAAGNVKQGSADHGTPLTNQEGNIAWWHSVNATMGAYDDLLDNGVCPEQARMVLPVCQETEWWWTGSVDAFARVVRLRTDPHAQAETRHIAERIDALLTADLGHHWVIAKQWEADREHH